MTAPAQPKQPLRERIFAWLDEDDHDLTPEQIEYNVAAGELIQLGAYGHCKYWPAGELHPREYLSRLQAAQDRFTDALLGLVQPDLDALRAEIAQLRERLASYGTPVLGPVPPPPVDQGALKMLALREEMERSGTTPYEFAVGRALCPAKHQCPSGLLALFELTKRGRLPVHRGDYGPACDGSGQKPAVVLRLDAASRPTT